MKKPLIHLILALICISSQTMAEDLFASTNDTPIIKFNLSEVHHLKKRTLTPTQEKIRGQLLDVVCPEDDHTTRATLFSTSTPDQPFVVKNSENITYVKVVIRATVSDELVALLNACGATEIHTHPRWETISCHLPITSVERIAEEPSVYSITEIVPPITHKENTSEGVVAHKVDLALKELGITGKGIKIGVLSDSVRYLSDIQARGDLPNVTVLPGQDGLQYNDGGNGEGTAMLEIVHDIAPEAELYFATAAPTDAQFADNILALHEAGCHIIVDDVTYFAEPAFQDGIIAQAVNEVTRGGCLYFSSAGNYNNKKMGYSGTYEGDFVKYGEWTYTDGNGNKLTYELHSFDGSVGNQLYYCPPSAHKVTLTLQWADPWDTSSNDYALFLYNFDLNDFEKISDALQSGKKGHTPIEYISYTCPGNGACLTRSIFVGREKGESSRYFRISTHENILQYATNGATTGHNGGENTISVGAASAQDGVFSSASQMEYYSSDGPRRIFFNPDGTAITPNNFTSTGGKVLQKVDFTAAAAVSCATPGFEHFTGTSAAAPHAAAIAALMLSANPTLSRDKVLQIMKDTAWHIKGHDTPWDPLSGWGIINAEAAIKKALTEFPSIPEAPTVSMNYGSMTWTQPEGANYYKIYRSDNPFGNPEPITGWMTTCEYKCEDPSDDGSAYFYFVKAASGPNDAAAGPFNPVNLPTTPQNQYQNIVYSKKQNYAVRPQYPEFHLYGCDAISDSYATFDTSVSSNFGASWSATFTKLGGGSDITVKIRANNGTAYDVANNPTVDARERVTTWERLISASVNTSITPRAYSFTSNASLPWPTANWSIEMGTSWPARTHYIYQAGIEHLSVTSTLPSPIREIGGHYAVTITATPITTEWTASTSANWIKLYQTSSTGSGVLGFKIEANEGSTRTGYITISGASKTFTIAIQQNGNSSSLSELCFYNPPSLGWDAALFLSDRTEATTAVSSFNYGDLIYLHGAYLNQGPAATNTNFTIRHEILNASGTVINKTDTTAQALEPTYYRYWNGATWSGFNNLEPGTYTYRCTLDALNVIQEMDETNNVYEYHFTILPPEELEVSPATLSAPTAGGSGTITVSSNCAWTATTSANWITISPKSGSQNGTLTYTVAENTTGATRSAAITVTSATLQRQITVTQVGTSLKPDLAFASFSNWSHDFGLFTAYNQEDNPTDVVQLFNTSDIFDIVFGVGNFGEGAINQSVKCKVEIYSETINDVLWNNVWDETVNLESMTGFSKRFHKQIWDNYSSGLYKIVLTLDADNQVVELDETNNTASFVFTIQDPISLNEGLGCSNLTFTNDGWYGTREIDGTTSSRTLHRGNNGENRMTTTVVGPGTLTFSWKVSSETTYDRLSFSVDDQIVDEISGHGAGWHNVTYTLGTGTHTVLWRYHKDSTRFGGYDCAWLKNVTWTPTLQAPVISSSTALTNGDIQLTWNAVAGATRYDLYRSTTSTRPATAYQTNVTSPYVDSNTEGGVTYYYWIAAVNGSAIAYSNRIQVQAKKTHDLTFEEASGLPWEESVFLSDSETNTTPIHQFTQGDPICIFFAFWNKTESTLETTFTLRHELIDAQGTTCATLDVSQTGPFSGYKYYGGTGLDWEALKALQPGAYRYRITLDATNTIPEVDETNNVREYAFTIVEPESLTVSKSTLSVSEEGESGLIDITANCAWTATPSAEWIQVSPRNGNGNSTLTYTVAENATGESRSGTIVVKSNTITRTITLTQTSIPTQRSVDLAFAVFTSWEHGHGIFTAEHAEGNPEEPIPLFDLNDAFDLVFGVGNFGEDTISSEVSMHAKIEAESSNHIVWSRTWNEDLSLASNRGLAVRFYDLKWDNRTAGLYRITVTLDADNQLTELDETDNTASFIFAIQDPVSLNEGLGCSNLTFTNDGWYGTREADGTTSARTLHRGDNSQNTLTTTVVGPGTLTFSWKVSSEDGYDECLFAIGDDFVNELSGPNVNWTTVSHTLGAGEHTLTWFYFKDNSVSVGYDCAWLKNVTWTPKASVTLPETVTGETATWLQAILAEQNITSGTITFAKGVTANDLEQARLLGVKPSIANNTIAVRTTFDVGNISIQQNVITFTATISVTQGQLPTAFSLGGTAKLMTSQTLNGTWTEVTPSPTNLVLTRISTTQATLTIKQTIGKDKFFKVIVK